MGFGILVTMLMSLCLLAVSFSIPYSGAVFDVPQQVLDKSKYVVMTVAAVYPLWVFSFATRSIMSQGSGVTQSSIADMIGTFGQTFAI
jgi:energy-converting hydrogenase Eha subunit A